MDGEVQSAPAEPAVSTEPAASPVAELTPYQRRKAREKERAEKRAKAKAAREAKKSAAEEKATPDAPAAAEVPEAPKRTDADRARDLAVFLQAVWFLAGLGSWLFGFSLDDLTEDEAEKDAPSWVPLARRYPWFDTACTWLAAPVLFFRRVKSKLKRRGGPPAEAPQS